MDDIVSDWIEVAEMDQIRSFADERNDCFCVYCGRRPETVDHVPSRVLLDKPYPKNLPVVRSCAACNSSFSLDEEYLACLVECVSGRGSVRRPAVTRILEKKPNLKERIMTEMLDDQPFKVEAERVRAIVVKLARGHAAYELGEPQLLEPQAVSIASIASRVPEDGLYFEQQLASPLWPEVGSRAMTRRINKRGSDADWIFVQDERYRYVVKQTYGAIEVRCVLSEQLGCSVIWAY